LESLLISKQCNCFSDGTNNVVDGPDPAASDIYTGSDVEWVENLDGWLLDR